MVLLSTLATATDMMQAMRDRRQGLDPSDDEGPEFARTYLQSSLRELEDALIAIRASHVAAEENAEDSTVSLTRRVSELMILNRLSRLLHIIHQRLLSLYPAVDENTVEEARLLEVICLERVASNRPSETAEFVDRSVAFAIRLKSIL